MRMVEIEPLENGAHGNQEIYNVTPRTFPIPDGWALIPDNMETPNFPFGEVEAEVVNGVMTVTKWTAGEIPPEPKEPLLRVDRLYHEGEIFTTSDGTMYKIDLEIPANGVIAVGTNCHVTTLNEELANI